jgi:hypothetical protein
MNRDQLEAVLGPMPTSHLAPEGIKTLDEAMRMLQGKPEKKSYAPLKMPLGTPAWEDKRCRAYLRKRGVPEELVRKHQMTFIPYDPLYQFRVIVPTVSRKRQTLTFCARDITGQQEKRYLFPKGARTADFLFNLNHVKSFRIVVVCEGVFDAVHLQKFGIPAVASFGKRVSRAQEEALLSFQEVILMFDSDAKRATYDYMQRIRVKTSAVLLPHGDPTSFDGEELLRMIRHRQSALDVAASLLL